MESKAVAARFSGHQGAVYALAPGIENGLFYSSGGDGWVVEWKLHLPEEGRLLARMPGTVYSLCALPEKQMLAVAVNRDGFHFLDPAGGKELFSIPSGEHQWYRMRLLPSGKILASGSAGVLALVDADARSITYFRSGNSDLRSLALLPGSGEIALGNSDADLRFLDNSFVEKAGQESGHQKTVFGLCAFPDGSVLISGGRDARLNLHRKNPDGQWKMEHSVAAHLFGIHDVALHPARPVLATASMDKTVKIWDAESLRLLRVLDRGRHAGHSHSVNQLCWLAESDLLLSCSDDRSILAWNIYV
jgi:WD40 repeat protein